MAPRGKDLRESISRMTLGLCSQNHKGKTGMTSVLGAARCPWGEVSDLAGAKELLAERLLRGASAFGGPPTSLA